MQSEALDTRKLAGLGTAVFMRELFSQAEHDGLDPMCPCQKCKDRREAHEQMLDRMSGASEATEE